MSSTIPGSIQIMLSLGLADQKPKDIFIGTDERVAVQNGRAVVTIGTPDLPTGTYEVRASFYPRWGAQDATAKAAGINSEIHARTFVTLIGTGESAKAVRQRMNGQRWVRQNIIGGTRWDRPDWVSRFGQPERLLLTAADRNPNIIKVYYFKSIHMTIFVNELKGEVSHWRTGRVTE